MRASWKHVEGPLRYAVEVRSLSFVSEGFLSLLRRHRIAMVLADTASRFPQLDFDTTDFVYVRLHGDVKIYSSGYTNHALGEWARRIRKWDAAGKDVYVYFDNDQSGFAVDNALTLRQLVG